MTARPFSMTSRPFEKPSSRWRDSVFQKGVLLAALGVVALLGAVFLTLLFHSKPSLSAFGASFLLGKTWDPVSGTFGAIPFLMGTLLTSFLALAISVPFALAISIFVGEYFRAGLLSSLVKDVTQLLAGIPSIIYGFWALFVLVPIVRSIQIKLGLFPSGVGILTASLILAVMIIPYAASIGGEVISLVPSDIKEAAYSLGATRQEIITKVILPHSRSGILAGILLALGRALGETMAVTMVIGNSNLMPSSLFGPGNTMASIIANEFTEATATLYVSALVEIGLVLFLVTTIINIIGTYVVKKTS